MAQFIPNTPGDKSQLSTLKLQFQVMSVMNVLQVVQAIPMKYGSAVTLFDTGTQCSLVRNTFARTHCLYGEDGLYRVELMDKEGRWHIVNAYGVDDIPSQHQPPYRTYTTYGNLKAEFSPEVQEVWASLTNRPSGEIDLLVGSEAISLHPVGWELRGGMKALSSWFGEGYVLNGTHPEISTAIKIKNKQLRWQLQHSPALQQPTQQCNVQKPTHQCKVQQPPLSPQQQPTQQCKVQQPMQQSNVQQPKQQCKVQQPTQQCKVLCALCRETFHTITDRHGHYLRSHKAEAQLFTKTVSVTWQSVPGSQYPAVSTRKAVPGRQYQAVSTRQSVPGSEYQYRYR